MNNEENKVVNNFDYMLYKRDGKFELFTKDGKSVKIIDCARLNKETNDVTYIGLIDMGDTFSLNEWNESGIDLNYNSDNDLEMVKYVKPDYNYITNDDVPDTQEFRNEYEIFNDSFKMSPVEYLRYKEFCSDHSKCCFKTGAIGGGIHVSFMPTGIGLILKAKCDICGTEVDITDLKNW